MTSASAGGMPRDAVDHAITAIAAGRQTTSSHRENRVAIYVANCDAAGVEMKEEAYVTWVDEASQVIEAMCGGVTALPPTLGIWVNPTTNGTVEEKTTILFGFIYDQSRFLANIDVLRSFVDRYGVETRQGEVQIEVGDMAVKISFPENQTLAP